MTRNSDFPSSIGSGPFRKDPCADCNGQISLGRHKFDENTLLCEPCYCLRYPSSPFTGDLKTGRRGIKPPLHWVPLWALQGVARVFAYGARKYAPGNWVKAAREPEPTEALQDYLSAAQRHWAAMQAHDHKGIATWGLTDDESAAILGRTLAGLLNLDRA